MREHKLYISTIGQKLVCRTKMRLTGTFFTRFPYRTLTPMLMLISSVLLGIGGLIWKLVEQVWKDEQKPHAPADGTASLWLVRGGNHALITERVYGYWYSPEGMLPSSVSNRPTREQKKSIEIKNTFPRLNQI